MRLITIPVSHYNERARWVLDLCGVVYKEIPHAPMMHMVAVFLNGGGSAKVTSTMGKTASKLSTPCCVLDDGSVMRDSSDIMKWACSRAAPGTPGATLYPAGFEDEVEAVEKRIHDNLGRYARPVAYWSLRQGDTFCNVFSAMVPPMERPLLPLLKPVIFSLLGISQKRSDRCTEKLREEVEWLNTLLEGGRKPFLVGDSLTAADITLAALAAPVLLVTEAEGNVGVPTYPPLSALPSDAAALIKELRDTPMGRHVLRVYKEHRPKPATGTTVEFSSVPALVMGGVVLTVVLSIVLIVMQALPAW